MAIEGDDYPKLRAFLRIVGKDWVWLNSGDLDENVDDLIGGTAWGLLREFEAVLTRLEILEKRCKELTGEGRTPESQNRNITALRCPFNANVGCMNGSTGVFEEFHPDDDVWGTTFRESGIMCAAWDSNRCGCTRLGKFGPGPQHAWSGYEGPTKSI